MILLILFLHLLGQVLWQAINILKLMSDFRICSLLTISLLFLIASSNRRKVGRGREREMIRKRGKRRMDPFYLRNKLLLGKGGIRTKERTVLREREDERGRMRWGKKGNWTKDEPTKNVRRRKSTPTFDSFLFHLPFIIRISNVKKRFRKLFFGKNSTGKKSGIMGVKMQKTRMIQRMRRRAGRSVILEWKNSSVRRKKRSKMCGRTKSAFFVSFFPFSSRFLSVPISIQIG